VPQQLYPQGKSPQYPLDWRLGGPQSQSGHGVEEENSQSLMWIEPRSCDHPACSQSLYQLNYPGSSNYSSGNIIEKVKVKLPLCFNWAPRNEGVLGEWRYSSTHSLTSALDGRGQLHVPAALPPRGKGPGTHWIGRWVNARAVLDAVVKKKIPCPRRGSNHRTPMIHWNMS
jgi:hypothetical protein